MLVGLMAKHMRRRKKREDWEFHDVIYRHSLKLFNNVIIHLFIFLLGKIIVMRLLINHIGKRKRKWTFI